MAGIVHPRRDLVDHHFLFFARADDEHFHRQHADIVEGLGDAGGDAAGFARHRRRHLGRHARNFQNMVAVLVFGDVEAFDLAVG